MQIIDIDDDPRLDSLNVQTGQIFAGHISEIVGTNYTEEDEKEEDKKIYHGQEIIDNLHELKTVWINHTRKRNNEFSVKISKEKVIEHFITSYRAMILDLSGTYFVVCNDEAYESKNLETRKRFFAIDSIEQLTAEFRMWKA